MKLFRVPPNPSYCIPHCSQVTPDGTFLYINFTQLFGIENKNGMIETFSLETGARVLAFDCDPDFARSRYVATSSDDKHVWIWDLESRKAVYGHTAHVEKAGGGKHRDGDDPEPLPLCFTLNKKVLTASKNRLVIYCVASNTYKIVVNFAMRHEISIMRASPYNSDIFALGTKAGLVMLMSLKSAAVLYTMRGHDTEIHTLDWITLKPEEQQEEDLFDMYTHDDVATEFGVTMEKKISDVDDIGVSNDSFRSKNENMQETKFDFKEACDSLRQDILGEKTQDGHNGQHFDETLDQLNPNGSHKHDDLSDAVSNNLSNESNTDNEEQNRAQDDDELTCLVSSAHESTIWVWDVKTGRSIDKINIPFSNKFFKTKTIVAKWLSQNILTTTDQNGSIILWNTELKDNNHIKFRKISHEFPTKAIIDIAIDSKAEKLWVLSMYGQVTCLSIDQKEPLLDFSTMSSRIHHFAVSPIDPNKIAIAGNKKILLLNVSNVTEKRFVMSSLSNQVKCQVLHLAWHPKKENYLAFSTKEGRVGVFDVANLASTPILMKPFFNNEVYSATWGNFRAKPTEDREFVLFCCGFSGKKGHLVYYPQHGNKRNVVVEIKHFQNVTAVLASADHLAIGTYDGRIFLCDLNDPELTPYYEQKVAPKLISSFDFKGHQLAVGSFDHEITVLRINDRTDIQLSKLKGHSHGVNFVSWHQVQSNLLVSASNDCTVRVWNTETEECESIATFEREVFSAIFHPLLEDTIVVGGLDILLTVYNYKETEISYKKGGKSMKKPSEAVMAKPNDVNVGAKMKTERKLKRTIEKNIEKHLESQAKGQESENIEKDEGKDAAELTTQLENIKLDVPSVEEDERQTDDKNSSTKSDVTAKKETNQEPNKSIKLNYSTLFFETHRELNRNPIGLLKKILSSDAKNSKLSCHEKLMSTSYDDVKSLLHDELKNMKTGNIKSVGHIALPIFTAELKSVIIEKVDSKCLTEEDLAVAPFVSHSFWQSCCLAYAYQCVEQNLALKALSYFLCCHEVKEAIAALCKQNYFVEAMALAKIRFPADDMIKAICERWTAYLDYCGNYEGAAIIWCLYGDHEEALATLERRLNPNEDLQEVLESLKGKITALQAEKKSEKKIPQP